MPFLKLCHKKSYGTQLGVFGARETRRSSVLRGAAGPGAAGDMRDGSVTVYHPRLLLSCLS